MGEIIKRKALGSYVIVTSREMYIYFFKCKGISFKQERGKGAVLHTECNSRRTPSICIMLPLFPSPLLLSGEGDKAQSKVLLNN